MNAVAQVIEFPAVNDSVDYLGDLLAQIADLEAKANKIKADLRARGEGKYEGSLFAATVSKPNGRQTLNSEAAIERLIATGTSREWIDENLINKSKPVSSVSVRARGGAR